MSQESSRVSKGRFRQLLEQERASGVEVQDGKGGPVHRERVSHETLQALALRERERPLQQIHTSLGGILSLPGSAVLSSYRIFRCIKRDWLVFRFKT